LDSKKLHLKYLTNVSKTNPFIRERYLKLIVIPLVDNGSYISNFTINYKFNGSLL